MRRASPAALLVVGIGVLGLVDSAYLTLVHYSGGALACATGKVVNCDLVTRSSYGYVPLTSVPVSLAGVLWFLVCGALGIGLLARPRSVRLWALQLGWAGIGTGPVLYLVWAEIVPLGHLCEYCTAAHLLTLVTLLVALSRTLRLLAEREGIGSS